MRLQAEPPLRVRRQYSIARAVFSARRAVHRLQEEVLKGEVGEALGRSIGLRIDQLQLVAAALSSSASALGLTQIQSMPAGGDGAVGLDGDLETAAWSASISAVIELQQRLAAGAARRSGRHGAGPLRGNGFGELVGGRKPAATVPSMPTKSVSQNVQTAVARSCSRPLQRLQPAKRRKTAGRPAARPRLAACRTSP